MLAGGTGITLIYQMMRVIRKDPGDKIKMYVVGGWQYSLGFITKSILRDRIPGESDDALALACGLPPMIIRFVVQPNSGI
ncbi:hypothetical protein NL676_038018 [Syzygium grande]|nr:hypothetical protein NL676_038018 [Syzygium grande]